MDLGLGPPALDQLGQLLGVLGGEVVALGTIGGEVVELPRVVVERRARLVAGHGLPAVDVHRPVAHHLEVLHRAAGGLGGGGGVEGVGHRLAGDRQLLDPAERGGRLDADELVDRRGDVGDVVELVADGAAVGDAVGPVHDARHVDPALVGVLLVPLEGRVAGLRPAPRVVGVAVRAADVVEVVDGLLRRLQQEVEELHLVEDAERAALLAGAVVGEQHDDRVVEQVHVVEGVDEATDLVVGVLEERGERLLEAGGQAALRVGQVVPRVDARVAGRQLGVGRDHAQLLLAGEPALAGDVPALVVAAPVTGEVLGRRLVRGVGGARARGR